MFDGHIHIRQGEIRVKELMKELNNAGLNGGLLISIPPDSCNNGNSRIEFGERLENLMKWTWDDDNLYPFFWIDPLEVDAGIQTVEAIKTGVAGFKIICDRFYPGDERCLEICRIAAKADKPVLFHSGILWDGKPSSEFSRPVHFENLLLVKNLRFSLAHIGWPWCDELIAVYGKFLNYRSQFPESAMEMYIDITPGTPVIYREEIMRKLFFAGYEIEKNLIFGSDCNANQYNVKWVDKWNTIDMKIYKKLQISKEIIESIYGKNLLEFILHREKKKNYRLLTPANS